MVQILHKDKILKFMYLLRCVVCAMRARYFLILLFAKVFFLFFFRTRRTEGMVEIARGKPWIFLQYFRCGFRCFKTRKLSLEAVTKLRMASLVHL